ncbi:MAG: TIGR01777 family oxidoreductase [Thermomicrobiaceae bacterium]
MKIIITGGTGLIGRALTDRLARDGDEIIILSRGSDRPAGLSDSARVVKWDARTDEGWSGELAEADAVVNLAGSNLSGGRWTESRKQLMRQSRIDAGKAVLAGIRTTGHIPPAFIQASGINYYGHREDRFIDESEPPGDDFLANLCVEWEGTTAPVEALGSRRVVIRSGPVLNVDEGALPPLAMPFHLFLGGRTGSGKQGISWIHINDEVEAIRFLIKDSTVTGPVNLCAPGPVTNAEFASALGRAMNRPSLFPVPGFALRTAMGEVSDTILLGQFAIPSRLAEAGYRFRFPEIEQALRHLLQHESGLPGSGLFRRGASAATRMFLP